MPIVFFINVNGIKIHFLFFIYIIITIVMISKQLFIYLFIPLSPPSELSLLLQQYTFFCLFFVLYFFFPIECQATCFKNSSYIFSKRGRGWYDNRDVCHQQGFDLVSIETEEEWKFIKHEIQKRGTWNTSAWHIGLWKLAGVWTWLSGEKLNISKWRDSETDGTGEYAEISKNGSLFNGITPNDENAYICEISGGKITFQP